MMFRKRFDFVFSIGEDCGCAMNLLNAGLRMMSSPFDWVTGASFEMRIDLLCREFSGFCDKGNLVHEEAVQELDHEAFYDKRFGFRFLHDFAKGVPLDESYPLVHEKYNRRIARTLAKIKGSRHVLAVWWSRDKVVAPDVIADAVARLRSAFPNNDMNLLVCQNDLRAGESVSVEMIGEFGARAIACFCPDLRVTHGDGRRNRALFRIVHVSWAVRKATLKRIFLLRLARFLGLWHFSRAKRRIAREKYRRMAIDLMR